MTKCTQFSEKLVIQLEGISPQIILGSKHLKVENDRKEVVIKETMEFGMQLVHDSLAGRYYVRKVQIKLISLGDEGELLASMVLNLADIPNSSLYC